MEYNIYIYICIFCVKMWKSIRCENVFTLKYLRITWLLKCVNEKWLAWFWIVSSSAWCILCVSFDFNLDSTFVPGLLPILKRLTESVCINSIVPGRLSKTNSSTRCGAIELRLTTSTITQSNKISSQKVLARSESLCQEVMWF